MPKCLPFGPLMAFKSVKCGDTRDKLPFSGLASWQDLLAGEGRDQSIRKRAMGPEAKDWKSHFNSSHCMTLNQPFLWLSLCFPTWTTRWLGQLISKASPTLTPCTQGPKRRLASLRKDILLKWLKHQEIYFPSWDINISGHRLSL